MTKDIDWEWVINCLDVNFYNDKLFFTRSNQISCEIQYEWNIRYFYIEHDFVSVSFDT